jgi:hypothetical protein
VGAYPITAAAGTLAATNYSFHFVAGTLTVTKAVLTVTAGNAARIYGAANPTFTDTITGFVKGDTAATAITGAASLTTTATASSPVGTYTITIAAGTLAATNYSFTFVNGKLTVTKAALTVTANAASRAYGAANPTFTDTITGFVNGDTVATATTGAASLTTTAAITSAVGSYTIKAAAGTLAATNYTFTFVNGTLTIGKATLKVTAQNASRTYGGTNPTFTYLMTGFLNGDTQGSATTGAPNLSTTATSASPAGSYTITAATGTLKAANYSFAFVNGSLTVGKATLKVTAQNASRTYGGANPTFTYLMTGFLNGDTQGSATTGAPSLTTTATSASPVGGYKITAAAGTLIATSYTFTFVNGTLAIGKATLKVTANNASMAYGGTVPTFTPAYTGFLNGDTARVLSGAPSLTTTATSASPVGSYTIKATAGTLAATNYTFTLVNGTLTIGKATLKVTAQNASRTYGGTNPTFTYLMTGFLNGDTQGSATTGAPNLSTTATSASPAGSYTITAASGTLKAANYSFAFVNGSLTVGKVTLTVKANDLSKTYGAPNPALTYTMTGFVNGDTQAKATTGAPNLTTTATTNSVAGTYPITPAAGTLEATSYKFTFVGGTLTVVLSPGLLETSVTNPPATRSLGSTFSVTDTVENEATTPAGASTTRYYLSPTAARTTSSVLLTGSRSVPALAANATSKGTVTVTLAAAMSSGSYYLLACANDTGWIAAADSGKNCKASASQVTVSGPDLIETAVTFDFTGCAGGICLLVIDTVENQGGAPAAASTTGFYLSDVTTGSSFWLADRAVGSLGVGATSTGTTVWGIPNGLPYSTYHLVGCANYDHAVAETNENNNCTAWGGTLKWNGNLTIYYPQGDRMNVKRIPAVALSTGRR